MLCNSNYFQYSNYIKNNLLQFTYFMSRISWTYDTVIPPCGSSIFFFFRMTKLHLDIIKLPNKTNSEFVPSLFSIDYFLLFYL